MNESEAEFDRLRRELSDVEAAFWKEYPNLAMGWQFVLGPLRVAASLPDVYRAISLLFMYSAFRRWELG